MTGRDRNAAPRRAAALMRRLGFGRHALVVAVMMAPFLILTAIVMVAPAAMLVAEAVRGPDGPTLAYVADLASPTFELAAWNSVVLSLASAGLSLVAGLAIALIANREDAGRHLPAAITSFSAVAANFGGVPLAFAFVSTLGLFGIVTRGLKALGVDIYGMGFTLYSIAGLAIAYAYFLTPLMVIVISPAIRAVRADWLHAARSLGASPGQILRLVVLPILAPSLVSAFVLLFGSAFSGYATAYALTSGNIVLLTTEIGNVLTGDVASAPQTGAALSVAMIAIMALLLAVSAWLGCRTKRGRR